MKNQLLIEIELPFCGFYCSAADERLDHEAAQYFDKEGDGEDHTPEDFWIGFNSWEDIKLNYVQTYTDCLQTWLADLDIDLDLTYSGMTSPKEYNFSTDRIFAQVPLDQLIKLYRATDKDTLRAVIKERFTSQDGFSSFYSNDLDQWLIDAPLKDWDLNQWNTVLLAAIGDKEINEWEVLEEDCGYEDISNAVHNAIYAWEQSKAA